MSLRLIAVATLVLGPFAVLGIQLHSQKEEEDACACLNWKDVYDQNLVKCGWEGHELSFVHEDKAEMKEKVVSWTGPEYCDAFFKHINANFCVNNGQNFEEGHMKHGQWCYVDSKCNKLNEGAPIGSNSAVSYKMCKNRQGDELLRDKSIEELVTVSQRHNLDLALLAKMAYPVWGQHEQKHTMWPYLKAAFGLGEAGALEQMKADDLYGMKWLQSTNKPMVFKSNEKGWPPLALVHGENVYEIRSTGEFPPAKAVEMFPAAWSQLVCVKGPACAKEVDECACLNWKETYAQKKVKCGWEGHELTFVHEDKPEMLVKVASYTGPEYCDAFFEHINDNFCVNNGQNAESGHMANGQWCYVDSKCGKLNGGKPIQNNTALSWKMCSKGQGDKLLRDKSVHELARLSQNNDIDLALLTKMSYSVWGQHEQKHTMWPYLKAAFQLGEAGEFESMNADDRWGMQSIKESNEPMVIKSNEKGWPPVAIVHGENVYEVSGEFPPAKEIQNHPGQWTKLSCVKGPDCKQVE